MRDQFLQNSAHWKNIILLLLFSYFMLMFGNGIISLTHPDEVFYIQSAREMAANNSWLTPMIFDEVQFEKPFLAFMMFAAVIKVFGEAPFVARFWPAFFGMLGVCITYWLAWMLFKKKKLAFLAGTIISSSFIYLALSRAVLTDMIFSIIMLISIAFFYYAYISEENKGKGLILCCFFSAIAVLTKGLLGFLFPAGAIIIYLIFKKDLKFLKCKELFWGLVLFLAVALPWHILMYLRHGSWFIKEYFVNVHFNRILIAEHQRLDNWYFYIALMFAGAMPWSIFWFPTIGSLFREFKNKTEDWGKIFFLLAYLISIYMFTQPAHSKLASYIFPAFPVIAIIIAYYLDKSLAYAEGGSKPKGLIFCGYIISILLLVVAVVGVIQARMYIDIIESMKPVIVLASLIVFSSFLICTLNMKKKYNAMVFSFLSITVSLLIALFLARPYVEPWVSCKGISEKFIEIDQSDSVVLASKFYVRGVRFYTKRDMAVIDINGKGFFSPHPIPFLNTDQKVMDFLDKQKTTYAVVKEGNVEDLKRILQSTDYIIKEFIGIGGKYILKIYKKNSV